MRCGTCGGTGHLRVGNNAMGLMSDPVTCTACGGRGSVSLRSSASSRPKPWYEDAPWFYFWASLYIGMAVGLTLSSIVKAVRTEWLWVLPSALVPMVGAPGVVALVIWWKRRGL